MIRSHKSIARLLRRRGEELLDDPSLRLDPFGHSDNPEALRLTDDIKKHPHAFVIACIMDRQMKAGVPDGLVLVGNHIVIRQDGSGFRPGPLPDQGDACLDQSLLRESLQKVPHGVRTQPA